MRWRRRTSSSWIGTLKRHNAFLDSFVPQTFIGNHDVTRIASQIGPAKAALALAVLMTVGGVPSIYYGDEQGYVGVKQERFGGDDDVRPKFPGSPAELSTLGEPTYRLHQALIALRPSPTHGCWMRVPRP